MNSQPQYSRGASPMPFIIIIVLLIGVITGLLVYHFMFYKPSLETCSNLYASNICTTEYCDTNDLCPTTTPPVWNPQIKTKAGSFLGYGVELPSNGDVATLYNTEITSIESVFDSNVCDTLLSMDLVPYQQVTSDADVTPVVKDPVNINCIEILKKIDAELANTGGLTWIERNRLLEARRAVIDLCAQPDPATGVRTMIGAATTFPTADINTRTGKIAKLFCK